MSEGNEKVTSVVSIFTKRPKNCQVCPVFLILSFTGWTIVYIQSTKEFTLTLVELNPNSPVFANGGELLQKPADLYLHCLS